MTLILSNPTSRSCSPWKIAWMRSNTPTARSAGSGDHGAGDKSDNAGHGGSIAQDGRQLYYALTAMAAALPGWDAAATGRIPTCSTTSRPRPLCG